MAFQDAFAAGEAVSDRSLCKLLKISRQTLYEWRLDRRFRRWMADRLTAVSETDWALILLKHTQLAIRGNVKSFDALLRAREVECKIAGLGPKAVVDVTSPMTNYNIYALRSEDVP